MISPSDVSGPLRAAFYAHTFGQIKFTRRMAIDIGDFFDMTPMQVVRHYETVGLLKRGSVQWFIDNGGITRAHIEAARAERVNAGGGMKEGETCRGD